MKFIIQLKHRTELATSTKLQHNVYNNWAQLKAQLLLNLVITYASLYGLFIVRSLALAI